MRKSYLLVYSNKVGSRSTVKNTLDSMDEVNTWRYDLDNCFIVVSESSAKELSQSFRSFSEHKTGRFIFSEIPSNNWGWLSSRAWFLIKHKKLKPKDE